MWAMTSYYNPVRYKRRLSNYRIFRENLGVPLITVELSFNGQFELTEEQADILIQISGGAVLWQKERLLNVALQAVPSSCTKVAWLDCDILFDTPNWIEAADGLLDCSGKCMISVRSGLPEEIAHLKWSSRGRPRLSPSRQVFPQRQLSAIFSILELAPVRPALHGRRAASSWISTFFSTLTFLALGIKQWPVLPIVASTS